MLPSGIAPVHHIATQGLLFLTRQAPRLGSQASRLGSQVSHHSTMVQRGAHRPVRRANPVGISRGFGTGRPPKVNGNPVTFPSSKPTAGNGSHSAHNASHPSSASSMQGASAQGSTAQGVSAQRAAAQGPTESSGKIYALWGTYLGLLGATTVGIYAHSGASEADVRDALGIDRLPSSSSTIGGGKVSQAQGDEALPSENSGTGPLDYARESFRGFRHSTLYQHLISPQCAGTLSTVGSLSIAAVTLEAPGNTAMIKFQNAPAHNKPPFFRSFMDEMMANVSTSAEANARKRAALADACTRRSLKYGWLAFAKEPLNKMFPGDEGGDFWVKIFIKASGTMVVEAPAAAVTQAAGVVFNLGKTGQYSVFQAFRGLISEHGYATTSARAAAGVSPRAGFYTVTQVTVYESVLSAYRSLMGLGVDDKTPAWVITLASVSAAVGASIAATPFHMVLNEASLHPGSTIAQNFKRVLRILPTEGPRIAAQKVLLKSGSASVGLAVPAIVLEWAKNERAQIVQERQSSEW